ncbi:helix-turn-helix domain-containing protein [Rhizosaccharibacter radicis]|uniref:LexA family transcriptional regulator n=1 Tax=Rhizosaccharibacter radicis TaxID=2782605 RepID=A0ABT1VW35_9PROT|nr:LexA family transcriptional regulator [Acetobacteraceae bacterium KSS12]
MPYEQLLSRIDARLRALGLSERAACMKADVGVNTIRHIRNRGHAPKPENLARLAAVLRVPPAYLLEAAAASVAEQEDDTPSLQPVQVRTVYVKGEVQAGVWREAVEWEPSDWSPIYLPDDHRYPGVERFGLLVRGTSMDRLYPAGSVVVVVRFEDIGRSPKPGERVVVIRRSATHDHFEATVKVFEIDEARRVILWPKSSDPEHQTPIVLPPMTADEEGNGLDGDHAAVPDIVISGLIIGSYRSE